MAVLELRHANFTEDPTITSTDVATTGIDVSEWTVLRNISPEETHVVVNHEFNLELYNSFALLPFEDELLQREGITTGTVPTSVIEPSTSNVPLIFTNRYLFLTHVFDCLYLPICMLFAINIIVRFPGK